jgi:GTP cyclohydrolase I
MDRQAASGAIVAFLRALGHEPEGELRETGALVAEAWSEELLAGERVDPRALVASGAVATGAGQQGAAVCLRRLSTCCMCPHHLLPSHGHADVAYLPGDKVAGFGAISRAVDACCRRLVLQEHAGQHICDAIVEALGARAVCCRLTLTHTCLVARGAKQSEAVVETLALAGSAIDDAGDRQLLLAALTATAPVDDAVLADDAGDA